LESLDSRALLDSAEEQKRSSPAKWKFQIFRLTGPHFFQDRFDSLLMPENFFGNLAAVTATRSGLPVSWRLIPFRNIPRGTKASTSSG